MGGTKGLKNILPSLQPVTCRLRLAAKEKSLDVQATAVIVVKVSAMSIATLATMLAVMLAETIGY